MEGQSRESGVQQGRHHARANRRNEKESAAYFWAPAKTTRSRACFRTLPAGGPKGIVARNGGLSNCSMGNSEDGLRLGEGTVAGRFCLLDTGLAARRRSRDGETREP